MMLITGLIFFQCLFVPVEANERDLISLASFDRVGYRGATNDETPVKYARERLQGLELCHESFFMSHGDTGQELE